MSPIINNNSLREEVVAAFLGQKLYDCMCRGIPEFLKLPTWIVKIDENQESQDKREFRIGITFEGTPAQIDAIKKMLKEG